MKVISEYIYCIIIAAIAIGIVENITPGAGRMKKQVEFVASFVLLLSLISPARELIEDIYDGYDISIGNAESGGVAAPEEDPYSAVKDAVTTEISKEVKNIISDTLSIPASQIGVFPELVSDDSGYITVTKIKIILPDKYSGSFSAVKKAVEEYFGINVEVSSEGP